MTEGSIQGMSHSVINYEVDAVEAHIDSLGKKMSIDRVASANSYITAYDLRPLTNGETVYELHCTSTFWFWCTAHDMHFEKMEIRINNNPAEAKFSTYENPDADPQIHDIRKTLSHELFHAMGIDHNPSSDSIVFYRYSFGDDGYVATDTDKDDLEARYP